MNIVAHNHQSRELLSSKISRFLEEFHVGRILKACNAYKVRGFSVKDVFQVAFENAFSSKSFFQKQRESSTSIPFAKDTFFRFMNSSSINWRKFTNEAGDLLEVSLYDAKGRCVYHQYWTVGAALLKSAKLTAARKIMLMILRATLPKLWMATVICEIATNMHQMG